MTNPKDATAKTVLALLDSKIKGDEKEFFATLLQIAATEARAGRRTNADKIRKAVETLQRRNLDTATPDSSLERLMEGCGVSPKFIPALRAFLIAYGGVKLRLNGSDASR